jgi:hypothetical protein
LNGIWELEPGEEDATPRTFTSAVPVPGLVDLADPSYDWRLKDYHWYKTRFELRNTNDLSLLHVRLDQAQFGTAVWLNGTRLGSSISCYTSQEYRIDSLVSGGVNELLVRVGARHTLPPESAVGKDQEQVEYIPGIWGDVSLISCGNPRVQHVQIIPHIDEGVAEVRATIENTSATAKSVTVSALAFERDFGSQASEAMHTTLVAPPHWRIQTTMFVRLHKLHLWSPESPFLYTLETAVTCDGIRTDAVRNDFGMREFTIRGKGFYLNGEKIVLKGGNIAFHRFLSDPERQRLPWDRTWIKRVLIDLPKEHNFNFFRNHLGQMYNAWYEIADQYGMLLQNEWHFWGTTGTKEQIATEFTEWINDNCNHPSIVMWDALNESTDDVVQHEIVPSLKSLDPTRPWESVDVIEEHPYIYSLGPVMNDRRFGFTRALDEIERSSNVTMLNEFIWWWLNREAEPTPLMDGIVQRWLGLRYSKEELLVHQAFLAQELVELFRRMRVDAIQPFVYLSNNNGPTAHWFLGPIKELQPKPILAALKNAFAPFGVSIELWDRHFFAGEKRVAKTWVFNDEPEPKEGVLLYGISNQQGEWLSKKEARLRIAGTESVTQALEFELPALPGTYYIQSELFDADATRPHAISRKIAHVFGALQTPPQQTVVNVGLIERGWEYRTFFKTTPMRVCEVGVDTVDDVQVIVVGEGVLASPEYVEMRKELTQFVSEGGVLLVIEPEYGVRSKQTVDVLQDLALSIELRQDIDKGGYDSYVFTTNPHHPLWSGLDREHLKMFNGGYGGEVVSQHKVVPSIEGQTLARCGLHLDVPAVMEVPYGEGRVIISRLQTRGRMIAHESTDERYPRRPDPVLQRYILNLVFYAFEQSKRTSVSRGVGRRVPQNARLP